MDEEASLLTRVGRETVESFIDLRGRIAVWSTEAIPAELCKEMPFHWNGTELVICSTEPVSWPSLESAFVDVALMAGNIRFQFEGHGSTDLVEGVAPEYRELLVNNLGPERGHATADEAGRIGRTSRLFITPHW